MDKHKRNMDIQSLEVDNEIYGFFYSNALVDEYAQIFCKMVWYKMERWEYLEELAVKIANP